MTITKPLIAISDCSNSLPGNCDRALEGHGYRIVNIPDKPKLLSLLDALLPDLIVTDIHSPSMDGLELLEEIKTCCRTSGIPVVVISDHPGLRREAMRLGAESFLVRPFGANEFLKTAESAMTGS